MPSIFRVWKYFRAWLNKIGKARQNPEESGKWKAVSGKLQIQRNELTTYRLQFSQIFQRLDARRSQRRVKSGDQTQQKSDRNDQQNVRKLQAQRDVAQWINFGRQRNDFKTISDETQR